MSGQILWGKFFLFTGIIMVSGWGIMRVTTPNEKQFYDVWISHRAHTWSLAPDLKRKVDQVRLQREAQATMRETLADAEAKDQIVWAEQLGSTKPSGGGRRV